MKALIRISAIQLAAILALGGFLLFGGVSGAPAAHAAGVAGTTNVTVSFGNGVTPPRDCDTDDEDADEEDECEDDAEVVVGFVTGGDAA